MFEIDLSPTYLYQVDIKVIDAKGKDRQVGFKAKFNRLSQDEIRDVLERVESKDINDRELVDMILVGWEGVRTSDGKPLEFNKENAALVCNIHPVEARIVESWFESLAGAQRKN